ncbi:MAG TPA: hypothetical protein VEX86_03795 [Longimicrobium sp.]|nr:hypothetical protein [Longimicrobium sp.]
MKLDRIARSAFALLAASAAGACARVAPTPPPPVPAPVPSAPAADGPRVGETAGTDARLMRCVVRNGAMEVVDLHYDPVTGDTSAAYPTTAEHAMNARWYVDNEPIVFAGLRYFKYGLPRLLGAWELVPRGAYEGVTVFVEPGTSAGPPDTLYLPVNARCMFQPYQGSSNVGAVRG